MTYRGKMSHGVVVLEGDKPVDGTWVDVTPTNTAVDATPMAASATPHPAKASGRIARICLPTLLKLRGSCAKA